MAELLDPSTPTVRLSIPGAPSVGCWLTTAHGGVSDGPYASLNLGLHVGDEEHHVIENRERVAAQCGVALDDLVFMDQTHSATVAVVTEADRGRGARRREHAIADTDSIVTTDGGVPLVVMVADCTPIVIVDPVASILAVVHAGWRGLASGIAAATVSTMVRLGGDPHRMVALVGPSVDVDRYEVGEEVTEALTARLGARAEAHIDRGRARAHVDLAGANATSLELAGLSASAITRVEASTAASGLFSDRRARPCGRFALVASLPSPALDPVAS